MAVIRTGGSGTSPAPTPSRTRSAAPWSAETSARKNRTPSSTSWTGIKPSGNRGEAMPSLWTFTFDTNSKSLILNYQGKQYADSSYIVDATGATSINPATGAPWSVSEYVDFWSNQNGYKDSVSQTRDILAAKGYMSREAYAYSKQNGNMPDTYFKESFSAFVRDASHINYTRQEAKQKTFLTIDDALKVMPSYKTTATGGGQDGRYVTINRQIFNEDDFRFAVDEAYRDITGMAADDKTLTDFVKVIQRLENKNPQKTVTVQKGKKQVSTTSGGLSSEAIKQELKDRALAAPGAEQYQKATTFMGYLMNAIRATGQ